MQGKYSLRNPNHIFADDTAYFITAVIYQKQPLLREPPLKVFLLDRIRMTFDKYKWELHHWVILDNHYHILGKSREGKDLSKIMMQIHNVSGFYIKQFTQVQQRIWWNYWDYCPRNEKDYFVRLNYLLINPFKHGYTTNLYDYPFSSFHQQIEQEGREALIKQFKEHDDYHKLHLEEDNF